MLKYLIIPLANDAVSFCHYNIIKTSNSQSISIDLLKNAIIWAMKRDLSIQFLYPTHILPNDVKELIETACHVKIVPSNTDDIELHTVADIVVFDCWQELDIYKFLPQQSCIIRTTYSELLNNKQHLCLALTKYNRINVVITDIEWCNDGYEDFLHDIIPYIIKEYELQHPVQLNILTDRLSLKEMNNCNAGYESLTLAPNGDFYICPAFWLDNVPAIGNLEKGIDLKNPQLFKLSHAPICRQCDAWQCKRCVWLNRKLTREVNTPSHEQCITSHIERNASQQLLAEFHKRYPSFLPDIQITEIDYLDPFDKIINNR